MIGGLLKDEKTETRIGVPFLSDLPFVGAAFRRTVSNTKKIDLLIFVKANIVLKIARRFALLCGRSQPVIFASLE